MYIRPRTRKLVWRSLALLLALAAVVPLLVWLSGDGKRPIQQHTTSVSPAPSPVDGWQATQLQDLLDTGAYNCPDNRGVTDSTKLVFCPPFTAYVGFNGGAEPIVTPAYESNTITIQPLVERVRDCGTLEAPVCADGLFRVTWQLQSNVRVVGFAECYAGADNSLHNLCTGPVNISVSAGSAKARVVNGQDTSLFVIYGAYVP